MIGVYSPDADAARLAYFGLFALQHRGQESAGIAVSNDGRIRLSRAMGYVSDVFNEDVLRTLVGRTAIGHVRYSTFGDSRVINAQPILIECAHGQIALCHNGNLVNATELRDECPFPPESLPCTDSNCLSDPESDECAAVVEAYCDANPEESACDDPGTGDTGHTGDGTTGPTGEGGTGDSGGEWGDDDDDTGDQGAGRVDPGRADRAGD